MPTEQWWWFWSKVCWVMAGWLGVSLLVSLGLLLAGCNTGAVPPPPPPLPPVKPVAAVPTPSVVQPAAEKVPDPATEQDAATEPGENEPVEVTPVALPPTFSTERILLLAPRNPLIVELQLTIDGRPHTQALDRLVEEVLKLADTDADGRPTWKEVVASKRFKYGQFGNLPIASENEYKQIIERYDIDRDGAVDAGELPRFLTRNAGSARAFSVRGSADYRYGVGRGSPLWLLLDIDEDGVISADERAAAPGRMFTRDTDDDEILLSGDLNPRVPLDAGMTGERRRRKSEIVRLLGPYTNWDALRLTVEEQYAGGGYLQADSFPLTPELFTQLDENKDGKLLRAEFAGLNQVPPHLVIAARFGQPEPENEPAEEPAAPTTEEETKEGEAPAEPAAAIKADEAKEGDAKEDDAKDDKAKASEPPAAPPPPAIELMSIAPGLTDAGESPIVQPGRITLRVAGTVITLYLNDTVAGGDFAAQAAQALMALDADKNGYLEAKEVPENAAPQLGQFDAVDADADGKVYTAEIVAFLKQQQAGLRAQIHAKASDREDPLFAALDQNRDERLDAREVDGVPQRLAEMDVNGDGHLSTDEIPESLVVGLARGNLENMDALFVPPPLVARAAAADTPRWFTAMDANGDGAISRREFLGPPKKFASLDTGGDGLLDAVEAKAAQP